MRVINLFAGPGAGKSTTAAGVFHRLKLAGLRIEYVSEYAKDIVWSRAENLLNDYLFTLANQHHRLERMKYHDADYVVTDSPIPIALAYMDEKAYNRYLPLVKDLWNDYDNDSYYLKRVKPYVQFGRGQNEDEAKVLDNKIQKLVQTHFSTNIIEVLGDEQAAKTIADRYISLN